MDPSDLSAQERAYAYIKGAITNFEFRPRFKLRAQDLAHKLKLSRTPVREALSRLEQEGLVHREGGWGYVVRPLTFSEVLDLYKVREVLEVEAAMEALLLVNPELLSRLEELLQECKTLLKKRRPWEFLGGSRRFHTAIANASGNKILLTMLEMISDRIQIVGALVIRSNPERARQILKENEAILAALRAGDARRLTAAVRNHVKGARDSAKQLLVESREHWSLHI